MARQARRRAAGFTLLEVMLAMAILSGTIMGLVMTLGRAVRTAHHARLLTTATFLCRAKLNELEDRFVVEGFTDEAGVKEERGDFKDAPYRDPRSRSFENYLWSWTIERIRLPNTTDMQAAASKLLQDKQQIGAGSSGSSPMSALGGDSGGSPSGSNAPNLSSGAGNMLGPVKEMLENGIRRVTVRVVWSEPGAGEQKVEVVSFYTDMRRIPLSQ